MQSASHRGEKVRRGLVLGHNITAQPSPGKSRGSIWESSEPDAGEQSPRARCELGGGRACSPDVGARRDAEVGFSSPARFTYHSLAIAQSDAVSYVAEAGGQALSNGQWTGRRFLSSG